MSVHVIVIALAMLLAGLLAGFAATVYRDRIRARKTRRHRGSR